MAERVYRGEIYYIHETAVEGSEQAGGRPAVIVSNDVGNEHAPVVEVVYLTTREKKSMPTHVAVKTAPAWQSTALCEQIHTVTKSRIGDYKGQTTEAELAAIDRALAVSLGLNLTIKANKAVKQWGEAYQEPEPGEEDTGLTPEEVAGLMKNGEKMKAELTDAQDRISKLKELCLRLKTQVRGMEEQIADQKDKIKFLEGQAEAYQYCLNCRRW